MDRLVQCKKMGKELPGLDYQPLKGELGIRIFENISKEAWKMWLGHSTMVINEYRLNPSEPEAQKILKHSYGLRINWLDYVITLHVVPV